MSKGLSKTRLDLAPSCPCALLSLCSPTLSHSYPCSFLPRPLYLPTLLPLCHLRPCPRLALDMSQSCARLALDVSKGLSKAILPPLTLAPSKGLSKASLGHCQGFVQGYPLCPPILVFCSCTLLPFCSPALVLSCPCMLLHLCSPALAPSHPCALLSLCSPALAPSCSRS